MSLIQKIVSNPVNESVWKRFRISPKIDLIKPLDKTFTQGHNYFFGALGKNIPDESFFFISHHAVIVVPSTGEIIAFDHGRFTFIIKGDPGWKRRKQLETLDGDINIEEMDEEWFICSGFDTHQEASEFFDTIFGQY